MATQRKKFVIAAIVVLAIVVIAAALRRRRKDKYTVGNPAEPREREAATDVLAALDSVATTGAQFQALVATLPPPESQAFDKARGRATAASVERMVEVMSRSRASIRGQDTHSGALALYNGLCDTDQALLGTARSYVGAGRRMQQAADVDPAIGDASGLSETGMYLIRMGLQMRELNESVHVLGVSLDLE
jgi:hypothetical protein